MGRERWKTALPVFVGGYLAGFRGPPKGPAGVQAANPLTLRVLPGRNPIRAGEARGFPSDTPENTRFVSVCAEPQQNKGLTA